MENKQFQLECNQLVAARKLETSKFIGRVLNKEGKTLEKSQAQIAILAHILPELLTYGIIERITTAEIAEACECGTTMVNNVLGFAGFKYERDKVTHKQTESKGLFERYYQHEYTDDTCTKQKRTSSVFNIVATQELFNLLSDELGLTIMVEEAHLNDLHSKSKEKAYTKKTVRETIVVTVTKESVVFKNILGTTESTTYQGIEEAMEVLNSLQDEVVVESKIEEMEVVEDTVEEEVEEETIIEDSRLQALLADDTDELELYELEDDIEDFEFDFDEPTDAGVLNYSEESASTICENVEEEVQVVTEEMEELSVEDDDDCFDDLVFEDNELIAPVGRRIARNRNLTKGFQASIEEDIAL